MAKKEKKSKEWLVRNEEERPHPQSLVLRSGRFNFARQS